MSAGANPISSPEDWDVLYLAGVPSPGVCDIDEHAITYKWDEKDGQGTVGASNTYKGTKIAHFNVTLRFWEDGQIDEWDEFQKQLLEIDAKRVPLKAADIEHPALSRLGITSVVSQKIGGITRAGPGLYTVKIELSQYMPPPKAKATANPDGSKTKKTTDVDPEIEAARAALAQARRDAGLPV